MELLGSPGRTLTAIVCFMLALIVLATLAYMGAGWSLGDAFYMVLVTVYTVGYGEVHPITTPYLRTITVALIILGGTGMILFTGALVQFLTITQLQQIFGGRRVKAEIRQTGKPRDRDRLWPHRRHAGHRTEIGRGALCSAGE